MPPSDSIGARYPEVVQAFYDVATALSSAVCGDELLHLVGKKVCMLLGIQRCSVYLRDGDSQLYRGQVGHTEQDQDAEIKRLVCGGPADAFTLEILKTRAPVVVRDAQRDPRPVRAAMQAWGVRSMLGVPMIANDDVIGLIFLDDPGVRHRFTAEEQELAAAFANLAATAIQQARRAEDLRASAATVARQNELLRRSGVLEERLTTLALEGATLHDIAAAVAKLTEMPCAIHDADFRRLATAAPEGVQAPTRSVLDRDVQQGAAAVEIRKALERRQPVVVGPVPAAGLTRRFVVAPILARHECWGYLVVAESGRRLNALDMVVARRAAIIAALELAAGQRATAAEDQAREALTRDLFNGNTRTPGLRERASFHGLRLDREYGVAVLKPRDGAASLSCAQVEAAFKEAGHGSALFQMPSEDGSVVLLLELPDVTPAFERTERAREMLESIVAQLQAGGTEALGAISSPCLVPGDCPRGLSEVRQVLRVLQTLKADTEQTVLTADDLGVGRLILATADPREVERFAHHVLGPLIDGDPAKVADLLTTLGVFFDSCRSIRRAAEILGVHENTVRYRLARVMEITGLDLTTNADHQLSGQLALLILRLHGAVPVARAPAAEAEVEAA